MSIAETRPTSRALLVLEAIQSRPGVSAARLADRLGVTERAVRRYVDTLREAGIPVESSRGPYGGYRIGRGVRLPPLVFSAAEALGLVMAVLDGHHDVRDDGEDADPVGAALGKIVRALPQPVAAQVEALRRTTAPAPDLAAARPDAAIVTALVQARTEGRAVRIDYTSEAGSTWQQEVDPWAVVVRHGRWYLLCETHRRRERRAFRVDRISAVEATGTAVPVPDDLDPVAELEDHLAVGWEYAAEVEVDAPVEQARTFLPRILGRAEPLDDGRTLVRGSTSNPHWYAGLLAQLPTTYRIRRGDEVRAAALRLADRLRAAAD